MAERLDPGSMIRAAAAIGPSPWVVLPWLWFGLTFSGPLNLMHECAHRLAFRRRTSSDLFGRRVLGPLALADFDAYRERHWAHHRNLGTDEDTKDAYLVDKALSEGRAALRNFPTSPVTRIVFGAYGFANHATHHREPGVAHYRPPPVTAALAVAGPAMTPTAGYISTLWRLGRPAGATTEPVRPAPRG